MVRQAEKEIKRLKQDLNEVTAYLDDFLAFLPLSICDVSPTGMISNINKAFEKLTNFRFSEVVGEYLYSFFTEKSDINECLNSSKQDSVVKNKELSLIVKGKGKIPVSASFAAKRDSKGELTGYFVGITDITILKGLQTKTEERIKARTKDLENSRTALLNMLEDTEAAKQQIEKTKNRSQVIFNNFIDGLLIFDSAGELELLNPRAEELLKIKQDVLIGKTIAELANWSQAKDLAKILEARKKDVFREELPFKEGELVVEVTTQTLNPGEEDASTLVILHDISREKVIERLKSQFVSVAAHQLRTPLSIIKWSLSMILEGEMGTLNSEQKEMLSRANQTNERMIRLINDLLNVARIEEGRFMYKPTIIDFGELVESMIVSLKPLAQKKGVKFIFKTSKTKAPKVIRADIEKLTLAVKNIIENAIFYTDLGGSVEISLTRKKNEVELSIKDSGIGIPKDQHDRVFTKFFRADNAVRKETEGTGLGLFIAKNVVESHKGRILFVSEEKKGTTFTIFLPAIG
ncbi:PAS domain-containing protein [Patescibacteria group bacterium]|nr:PAS domain-containing protein [Patescibacteria group bacterium]MBU4162032.1 PAS domain-containing protein [Patescibacteria group bacterium]